MAKHAPFLSRAIFKPTSDELGIISDGFDDSGLGAGYAQVWHKRDRDPYVVASEFVAGNIAQWMRLPIQPFAITYFEMDKGRIPVFSSLDFNYERASLPEVDADACLEHLPDISAGILVFDILVANEDRVSKNMVADRIGRPRRVVIYDHGMSLLRGYGDQDEGVQRLEKVSDSLGITKTVAGIQIPHMFLRRIKLADTMWPWVHKAFGIPGWFIRDVCECARKQTRITAREAKSLGDFLDTRRQTLSILIEQHKAEFTGMQEWVRPGSLF